MKFIKVNWKQITELNPKEIGEYVQQNYRSLRCEDIYRLDRIKNRLLEANKQFGEKFFNCEIMRLAQKQAAREHPENFPAFVDAVFDNAHKILKYKIEQRKQRERRAKRKHLTK